MSRLSQKRIDAILARQEPAIRKAFLDAIAAHKGAINMAALAEALERGDIQAAIALAQISPAMLYPVRKGGRVTGMRKPRAPCGGGAGERA